MTDAAPAALHQNSTATETPATTALHNKTRATAHARHPAATTATTVAANALLPAAQHETTMDLHATAHHHHATATRMAGHHTLSARTRGILHLSRDSLASTTTSSK